MKTLLEKFKGWKTVVLNVGAPILGAFYGDEAVAQLQAAGLSAEQAVASLLSLWAALNVLLRAVSNTPIFKKAK